MKKQISIRMSEEIFNIAKTEAYEKDCSINSIIIQWIKKGMKYEDVQKL